MPPNRCLYLFTTLLWSTFFVATIVLHQVIDAYPGMVKKADTDPRARLFRAKEIAQMMLEIRKGDYRLVRPSPTKDTETEQHRYCTYKINAFMMTLCTSTAGGRSLGKMAVSLHKRGLAAEAIGLCLTNQPQFRDNAADTSFMTNELNKIQQNQLVAHSLAEGLHVLLKEALTHYQTTGDGVAINAMAQGAETVWIAAFHHPQHIENFLKHKLIDILGEIILTLKPESMDHKLEHGYAPARAIMWASAALQNLAAYYCDNDLGYCIWEWDGTNMVLDEETRLDAPELADQAREQIAAVPNLLETLSEWVCQGPIQAKANETYGWPGDSILWKDLTFNAMSPHLQSPSIVPWAAAGVFKNLLLGRNNPELQERIHNLPHLSECLCQLKRSPDWLENSKSSEAIFRWSPDAATTLCPDIYATCQDDTDWENADSGDNCVEYETERWCIEYGEDVDANGKTANQACCACGGGYPKDAADGTEITADDNTTSEESAARENMGESLAEAAVEVEADSPVHEEL